MKIRYFIILLNIIIVNLSGFSQIKTIKKADSYYNQYYYEECIRKFENVHDKSVELKRKLAESYFKTGDYFNAEKYYGEVAQSDKSNSDDIYNYASILRINQEYDEADKWMEKFCKIEKGDSRAVLYMHNKDFINELLNDREQFKIKNIKINTSAQDFGTAFYGKKQVVFASTRPQRKLVKRIWNWNRKPFLDIFIADIKHSQLDNVKHFKKKFNKKYHEGPASFDKSGNFMAYTVNNYKNKSVDGTVKLQIFTSEKIEDKWQKPVSIKFNSSEYSVGHPALSEDGKTMYFASDMPDGYGGIDLYVTHKNEKGEWSNPLNLGKPVNTEGNEMFPSIHKDGILFFASDGLLGLGGLDIFITKKTDDEWMIPQNIGIPVNSNYDDFALILNDKMNSGFFSSNRKDGKGDDDIYSFKLLKPLMFDIIIKGKVKDSYGNVLADAEIILFDQEGNPVKTVYTDENGHFEIKAHPNELYIVEGSKPKYLSSKKDIDTKTEKTFISQNLILEKMPDFILHGLIIETKTNNPLENVKVIIKEKKTDKHLELYTIDKGDFFLKLLNKHLYDTLNYTFVFKKNGYASKSVSYNEIISRYGEYILNVQMNKIETGEDLGKLIDINPIYFDFSKYNIRPDAALELDKIVKIMNEYPMMEIELSSHTDCRGTSIYNLKLSDRRAKASADYIKKRISKPTRISGRGYGETQPVNDCACEGGRGKGIGCSEEQHQQNRRTEFKIIRK